MLMNHSSACSMGNMSMDMDMPMSMQMSFFFGYQCQLLFSSFNLETPGQLFGGIVLIMVVAILYEGLKTLREFLAPREVKKSKESQLTSSSVINMQNNGGQKQSDKTHLLTVSAKGTKNQATFMRFLVHAAKAYCSPLHFLQSLLHTVQVGVAYLLMLVAMTYNGWLFLAVCIGAGLGYFLFGACRKSYTDFRAQSEHCH